MKTNDTMIDFSVLKQVLETKPNIAQWQYTEKTEELQFGGTLTIRGWTCSHCGFFRRKKRGMSKFCEDCGYKMEGEVT